MRFQQADVSPAGRRRRSLRSGRGLLLGVALAVVFVILIIVYRSPLLPIIVLGTSIAALTAALFVVVQLAKADVIALSGQTQGILMILVIGAATDYSLLYTARFREALRDHEKKWDATWAALRGSVLPILASAGTVMTGLLCLVFSELYSNRALGPIAAIGVAFASLAALTLLPALLFCSGRVAFWPVRPKVGSTHVNAENPEAKGVWPAAARLISKRPRTAWVTSALVLGALAVGLVGLKSDGVPQSEFVIGHSEARDGQAMLASFAGAMGVSAVVFDAIFDFPGADPGVPMFGFVFLVALGIDYNIFLMTRVREESAAHGTRSGVLRGLVATGGVITSAGVVLAATFAALGVLPVLFLAQIAFIVAFGVLLDTVVVRSLLVPALSYDIGRAIWWPSRLARGHR